MANIVRNYFRPGALSESRAPGKSTKSPAPNAEKQRKDLKPRMRDAGPRHVPLCLFPACAVGPAPMPVPCVRHSGRRIAPRAPPDTVESP